GELDDISGSGQTEAVHAICSGVDKRLQKHYEVKGAGHYGIFSGRRWREMVYPEVKSFILQHQPAKPVEAKAAAPRRAPRPKAAAAPAVAAPAPARKSAASGRKTPARKA
ncbi:MAG: polyhydroxyalkanoate depolymerase, partial [Rhodoferax sp.]|nr:polyhydroxyalkanoate depolymerase [Rhodoferax sp.]